MCIRVRFTTLKSRYKNLAYIAHVSSLSIQK